MRNYTANGATMRSSFECKYENIEEEGLTIVVVNYNSSDFILTSLSIIERLTVSKWRIIICDNGSNHADFVRLSNAVSRYENITLMARTQTQFGSLGHGEALNLLVSKIKTRYGVVMDADCIPLIYAWDIFLISKLSDAVKIAGAPLAHNTPGGSKRVRDFPLIFLSVFETRVVRELNIDFRPRDIAAGEDTGWELHSKFHENGYVGSCLFGQNTRMFSAGEFSSAVCDEYYTDSNCRQLICSHFGRGSNPRSGKYLRLVSGRWYSFKSDKARWLGICREVAYREMRAAIQVGKLNLDEVNCPACMSSDVALEFAAPDWLFNTSGYWSVVKCKGCGLRRTNPRPKKDDLAHYYPNDYAPHYPSMASDTHSIGGGLRLLLRAQTLRQHFGYYEESYRTSRVWWLLTLPLARIFHLNLMPVLPQNSKNKKLLEIGCSHGERLAYLRRLGWEVQGVEFSGLAASKARDRGIACETAFIENCEFQKESFDVIIMSMVLEHLGNPAAAILRASLWLRPGGTLLMSVPNFRGFEARIFGQYAYTLQVPTHLTHFDKCSLKKMLLRFEFGNIKIRSQIFHRDFRTGLQTYLIDNPDSFARHMRNVPKIIFQLFGLLFGILGASSRISVSAVRNIEPIAKG